MSYQDQLDEWFYQFGPSIKKVKIKQKAWRDFYSRFIRSDEAYNTPPRFPHRIFEVDQTLKYPKPGWIITYVGRYRNIQIELEGNK